MERLPCRALSYRDGGPLMEPAADAGQRPWNSGGRHRRDRRAIAGPGNQAGSRPAASFPNGIHRPIGLPARVGISVSEMRSGIVLLSVPLLDDVIQVGAAGTLATGTIEVAKSPSAMVIRRTDGRLLQAQILHQCEDGPALRMSVFCDPVRTLRLRCVPHTDAGGRWIVLPGSRIRRPPDLFQLVETITAFGLAKQCSTDCLPAAAATPTWRWSR